jgi:hypothetical protein
MQNHHPATGNYNAARMPTVIKNLNMNANHHFHHRESSITSSKIADYYPPLKAKRKRASPSQLSVLNRVFNQTYFPSTELRIELGKHLGMSPRTVQIWFQNKRQSLRSRTRRFSFSSTEADEEDAEETAASVYYTQQMYHYEMSGCPSSPPWTPTGGSGSFANDSDYPFILPPPSTSSGSSPAGSASPMSASSPVMMMDQDEHHHKINLPPLRLHTSHFYPSSPGTVMYPSPVSIDPILH